MNYLLLFSPEWIRKSNMWNIMIWCLLLNLQRNKSDRKRLHVSVTVSLTLVCFFIVSAVFQLWWNFNLQPATCKTNLPLSLPSVLFSTLSSSQLLAEISISKLQNLYSTGAVFLNTIKRSRIDNVFPVTYSLITIQFPQAHVMMRHRSKCKQKIV